MRGKDEQQLDVFSYVSPEQRVPQDHPLHSLRAITDEALRELQPRFNKLYTTTGRPLSNHRLLSRSRASRVMRTAETLMSGFKLRRLAMLMDPAPPSVSEDRMAAAGAMLTAIFSHAVDRSGLKAD